MVYHAKKAGTLISDTQSQVQLLTATKTVSISSQQLLLAGDNLLRHHPEDTIADKLIQTALSSIEEGVGHLLTTSKSTMSETVKKLQELNNSKNLLQNFLLSYCNPFYEVNEISTLEDVKR